MVKIKTYMGIDIGSISTKGVIVDSNTGYTLEDYLEISGSVVYSGVCLGKSVALPPHKIKTSISSL